VHELLRQYAEERLNASPDSDQTLELHGAYYAELLSQQWKHLRGSKQKQALVEIGLEIDNVRFAWFGAVRQKQAPIIEKMLNSLWFFYDARCCFDLIKQELNAAAEALSEKQNECLRGKVLARLVPIYASQGHLEQARAFIEESIAIFRRLGTQDEMPFALTRWSDVAGREGDAQREKQLLEEALAISREVDDRWQTADILSWLGLAALFRNDYEQATMLCQESLVIFRQIGNPGGIAHNLSIIGWCAYCLGDLGEAKQLHQQHLTFAREADNHWHLMEASLALALAAWALGESQEALSYFDEGLTRALPIGVEKIPAVPSVLAEMAALFVERGERIPALEYLSLALHQPYWKLPQSVKYRALHLLARLGAEMQSDTFQAAVERGKALDLRTAVVSLLARLQAIQAEASPDTDHRIPLLNERELEVLCLVADGLSNREIAEQLVLAVSTVKWYTGEIFGKLHVTSRTQAVARARALGLLS
jgi:non-specific serine/threonine protein kinase